MMAEEKPRIKLEEGESIEQRSGADEAIDFVKTETKKEETYGEEEEERLRTSIESNNEDKAAIAIPTPPPLPPVSKRAKAKKQSACPRQPKQPKQAVKGLGIRGVLRPHR